VVRELACLPAIKCRFATRKARPRGGAEPMFTLTVTCDTAVQWSPLAIQLLSCMNFWILEVSVGTASIY
jgi:hypothetical protein